MQANRAAPAADRTPSCAGVWPPSARGREDNYIAKPTRPPLRQWTASSPGEPFCWLEPCSLRFLWPVAKQPPPGESTPGPTPTREAPPPQTPTHQPVEQVIPSPTPTAVRHANSHCLNADALPWKPRNQRRLRHPRGRPESRRTPKYGASSMPGSSRSPQVGFIPAGCGRTGPSPAGAPTERTSAGRRPPGFSTRQLAKFSQIDAGHQHSCAIRQDGAVECWGGLPLEDIIGSDAPPEAKAAMEAMLAPPEGRFKSLSTGFLFSCGVRIDNSAECWGLAVVGSRGAFAPPDGKYTSVSAGGFHACGIRTDQTVVCWGGNRGFDGDFLGQATPPDGPFEVINAGGYHTCGFRPGRGNQVLGGYCGGRRRGNHDMQTAIRWHHPMPGGPSGDRSSQSVGWRLRSHARWQPQGHRQRAGLFVRVVGRRPHRMLGFPVGSTTRRPRASSKPSPWAGDHGCGLRPDGSIECWGDDDFGQASPP